MSSSKSLPLFLTALLVLMLTACAEMPTPPTPAEQEAVDAHRAQYEKAKAVFDERCKTAGVKIYRTVENVEGVFLVDVRPEGTDPNWAADPNWPSAGTPEEQGGMGYIRTLLLWETRSKLNQRGALYLYENKSGLPTFPGYSFVDVNELDGRIVRYTLEKLADPKDRSRVPKIFQTPLSGSPARYAISRTNHMDPADRALWVAGATVTITDTQTNEVLATSTWYSFEPGQGSTAGYRQPWLFAQTCPTLPGQSGRYPTRSFAEQVLKPKAH